MNELFKSYVLEHDSCFYCGEDLLGEIKCPNCGENNLVAAKGKLK